VSELLHSLRHSSSDGGGLASLNRESVPAVSDGNKSSTLSSFISTTLGFLGIGLLTYPYSYRFVGVAGGTILILIVAAASLYAFKVGLLLGDRMRC
jgi:hypothetical protein